MTLTVTLDRVTLHTVMHHSSTSTYIPNVIEIEETFCGRTDVRTYGRADRHLRTTLIGPLGRVDLKVSLFLYFIISNYAKQYTEI